MQNVWWGNVYINVGWSLNVVCVDSAVLRSVWTVLCCGVWAAVNSPCIGSDHIIRAYHNYPTRHAYMLAKWLTQCATRHTRTRAHCANHAHDNVAANAHGLMLVSLNASLAANAALM